jgi:hypothetical protein
VRVDEEYDATVWSRHQELLSQTITTGGADGQRHQQATTKPPSAGTTMTTYQPDIHYPWLLRLVRPQLPN